MTGAKGRSGGARKGAGRKPAKPRRKAAKAYQTTDPDEFLRVLMSDPKADFKDRMVAALALKKTGSTKGPMGKREQRADDAREVVSRSLAPSPAPTKGRHLRAVK